MRILRGTTLMGLALLVATTVSACAGDTDSSPPAATPSASASSAAVAPDGVDVTQLEESPVGLLRVGDEVWATLPLADAVRTEGGVQVPVGSTPLRLAQTASGVWVSLIRDGAVAQIDPDTDEITRTVRLPRGSEPEGLVADGSSLWIVDQAGDRILEIDAATGQRRRTVPVADGPRLVTREGRHIAVSAFVAGTVTVFTVAPCAASCPAPTDRRDLSLPDCFGPQGVTFAGGLLWVACTTSDAVYGVDVARDRVVVTVPLDGADAVFTLGDTVLAVGQVGPTVVAIDAATREAGAPVVLDSGGAVRENVDLVAVEDTVVVSHPELRRLYDVPLTLLVP
ncbi:MAG: hypothetical protein F2667_01120 [Actinobacteria bacterium]|uniref:Unannotated protein n=1 Tax=freshwater metagenome TaxID=449393 RepID=A0A6J6NNC0_9ZZZZ|nr:hypothetical protein [Actinomycetota bacterium]